MKVLLTGATGFLGSVLACDLEGCGHTIAHLGRPESVVPDAILHVPAYRVGPGGTGIREAMAAFQPDVVVHLAACYVAEHQYQDIEELITSNLLFGNYLLDAMSQAGVHRLVYAGSSWQHYEGAAYRPANLYAATKQAFSTLAEFYCDAFGLCVLELHLYDAYGEGDRRGKLLWQLEQASENGSEMALSPGQQQIHLLHVDDVSRGFVMACDQIQQQLPGERKVYRLPSERARSLREVVDAFQAAAPERPVQVRWGARPYRPREVFRPWEEAEILPGWSPRIALEEGLRRLRKRTGYGCNG